MIILDAFFSDVMLLLLPLYPFLIGTPPGNGTAFPCFRSPPIFRGLPWRAVTSMKIGFSVASNLMYVVERLRFSFTMVSQCSSANSSFRMMVAALDESFEICWLTRLAHSTNIMYFWWQILCSSSNRDEQMRQSKKFFSYWMRASCTWHGASVAVLYVWPCSTIRTDIPGWWHATQTGWFMFVWPSSVMMSYAGKVAIDVIMFRDHGVIWINRRLRSSVRLSMVCTRDRK